MIIVEGPTTIYKSFNKFYVHNLILQFKIKNKFIY